MTLILIEETRLDMSYEHARYVPVADYGIQSNTIIPSRSSHVMHHRSFGALSSKRLIICHSKYVLAERIPNSSAIMRHHRVSCSTVTTNHRPIRDRHTSPLLSAVQGT